MLRTYQPKKRHRSKVHGWLPQENGYRQRPQGPGSPPCQGQSQAVRLRLGAAYTAKI